MRMYREIETKERKLKEVICNQCGKRLEVEDGILKEGCFHSEYPFDYFSKKDGFIYTFDLCEACFDGWIDGFSHPAEITETREYL